MFYSESLLLSKKGPLAKVWLAAHWERKLSKVQLLGTDITQSVGAIISPGPTMPLALRLSGQLLLGVVRIYSRKSKYLLEDCNDALMRLRMIFKPGHVDLSTEDLTVSKAAITLPQSIFHNLDMEMLDVDFDTASLADMPVYQPRFRPDAHLLPGADLTDIARLAELGDGMHFPLSDLAARDRVGPEPDVELDSNGDIVPRRRRAASIGSIFSVEVGRAAPAARPIGEELADLYQPDVMDVEQGRRQLSAAPEFDDFGGLDFGDDTENALQGRRGPSPFNFDLGPRADALRSTPPPFGSADPDTPQSLSNSAVIALTPTTRERILKRRADETRHLGKLAMLNAARKSAKKMKFTVDAVTELEGRPNKRIPDGTENGSDGAIEGYLIARTGNFMPRTVTVQGELTLEDRRKECDLKTLVQRQKEVLVLGTPSFGLPAAMTDLWSKTIKLPTPHSKHLPARRPLSEHDILQDFGDLPDYDDALPARISLGGSDGGFFDTALRNVRAGSVAASANGSRAGSMYGRTRPASEVQYKIVGNEANDVLAVFRKSSTGRDSLQNDALREGHANLDARTTKAAKILDDELSKDDSGQVSLQELTKNTSRQAASTMFFQILMLTAQRGIRVKQAEPFGDVVIRRGERLDSIVGKEIQAGR